jgi:predicted nuclease of predicted toxin-antitoxin system
MSIRFHLDEHISSGIAAGLRRRAIDVTTTADTGLMGADDAAQLAFASSQGRVMVTQDADFLRLHAAGMTHAGIAYCLAGALTVGELLRRLILIYDLLSVEEMKNRIEFL